MKNTLKISLKPREKIYINGAVVRVDRKATIEFLNDVQFLLEGHVLQAEEASTPLRQLYFILQMILMNPGGAEAARDMFRRSLPLLIANFGDPAIRSELKHVDQLVAEGHIFDALKGIRSLYALETVALASGQDNPPAAERRIAVGDTRS
ncbi:MAG: flagellar biosynthesis repressor FlbT [Rhizobiaceae bacterium]